MVADPESPEDDIDLESATGYRQEFGRYLGFFSNFAISFSTISILTGAILLYGYGLKFAGPIANTIGWPVVSVFTVCVAASMAELASIYPTAGGLYYWAFRLGNRGWAWLTGWLNMIGQLTITAGINIAAATYLIGAATKILDIPPDATVPVAGWRLTDWYFQISVMVVIMIPQILVNIYGSDRADRKPAGAGGPLLKSLNDKSVLWHMVGVLLIVCTLTAWGTHRNDLDFMLSVSTTVNPLDASSATVDGVKVPSLVVGDVHVPSPLFRLVPSLAGWYAGAPFLLVFVLSLLQPQWTYTGYDASAHVAEETLEPGKNSALGVFFSVAISAVVGYVMLLVLTWSIPDGDVAATANDPYPVLYILSKNLPAFWTDLIAVAIGGAMWLCGLASMTSMSRMWFAVARDGGVPVISRWLRFIHPVYRTPAYSILITSLLTVLICVYAAAFYVITSISTIALYLAYIIPILLNLRNRIRRKGEFSSADNAAWYLGRWGPTLNVVAICWVAFLTVIFCLPPNELVLWSMLALALALLVYWWAYAKWHFKGPPKVPDPAIIAPAGPGV